ncbi:SlyX family protein [Asticcacaulis solisilvae]|uniref:SlyX family protein n=1 Tax=Asticcacaulis solisilvae TaxID=1217274 RepID=UPI003FD7E1A8
MSEDRVIALEEMVAHQARTIDELSDQLAEQWKTIDRMRRTLERLSERLIGLEERTGEPTPVTKPPHY